MKQILQYQKTGEIIIEELPSPEIKDGWVLVKNIYSVISTGTEKTSVETAQASMIGKAKSRPDLVKQVMDNVKKEGLFSTWEKVKTRLDNYKELGYSCAGLVLESGTKEFRPGDRVACGGATANHSEIILVPKNLTVKIPDEVDFDEAAFTTIGAIAMQGVRQADLRVGENCIVIGLGLLGLITIQILKASGCKVAGLDISDSNFEIAKNLGCDECFMATDDSTSKIETFTNGYGSDAVIITAGTKSNDPVENALNYARKKSKVVVVGAVGMNIPRSPFYEKEIDFRISCSYGPGRYDINYEENGDDYPIAYVRWTERRNMQAILELIFNKKLNVKSLITHKIPIREGLNAYNIITGKSNEKHLGVLIMYSESELEKKHRIDFIKQVNKSDTDNKVIVGFVGAGNFAQSYLIPNLHDVILKGVATDKPINANSCAKKFGFEFSATNADEIFKDAEINSIFVATRHDSHSQYVINSLKSGKNVFVEKPLAINFEQLSEIKNIYEKCPDAVYLMTGYNRRFSKPFKEIQKFFSEIKEPFVINYRINAGYIPKTHWTQDPSQGGRIIGEVCHFIDTISFIINSNPIGVYAQSIESQNNLIQNYDSVSIVIKYENGSVGNILYLSNGDSSVFKEYCEIFAGNKTAIMDNYKQVSYYSNGKNKNVKYDGKKGHKQEVEHFVKLILGKDKINLTFESIYLTTLTTFRILESLQSNKFVTI